MVEEKETVVVKSNVAGIIAAIALLILVLGALKYFGLLPF
jgi:hypothetical protein